MTKTFDPRQWVSQAEAAAIRGVSRQAISRLIKRKRLATLQVGGKTLLRRLEIERFERKRPGPARKKKSSK
jgi:excisionase family DNA binding protein